MAKVFFCLFSVVIGAIAIFIGFKVIFSFEMIEEQEVIRLNDPPLIFLKEDQKTFEEASPHNDQLIVPAFQPVFSTRQSDYYTFSAFKRNVERLEAETGRQIDVMINRTDFPEEGLIKAATAVTQSGVLTYEPSLLIMLSGYGDDELIVEIDNASYNFLRVLRPFADSSSRIAAQFREKDLKYAVDISTAQGKEEKEQAMAEALYPRYAFKEAPRTILLSSNLSPEETALRMKGIIYDKIIEALEKGFAVVAFDASIKHLKSLQQVLEDLSPLPIRLVGYPLWSE